jgi:hypothetical protein
MHRMLNEERFVDDAADVDDEWDDDVARFDDMDFDEAAFDDLSGSDWPRAAVDACAPEGAFDAR